MPLHEALYLIFGLMAIFPAIVIFADNKRMQREIQGK